MSLYENDQHKMILWQRAKICPGYDPYVWRYDPYGRVMKWQDYGNRNSQFGWEIDHVKPQSAGGSDNLSNLQALNWQSNAAKSDRRSA